MPSSGRSSPGKAAAPGPLAGTCIFLHIRDPTPREAPPGTGGTSHRVASARQVKRESRALTEQLGASLTVSAAAASLVVGMHATPAFLESCAAAGRAVVSPKYLRACAAAGRRLDMRDYLVQPPSPASTAAAPSQQPSRDGAVAGSAAATTRHSTPRKSQTPRRKKAEEAPPATLSHSSRVIARQETPAKRRRAPTGPVWAANAIPLLLLDEEDTEAEASRKPASPITVPPVLAAATEVEPVSCSSGSDGTVTVTPPQSIALSSSPHAPVLFMSVPDNRDDIRHAVLRSSAAASRGKRSRKTESDEDARRAAHSVQAAPSQHQQQRKRQKTRSQPNDPFLSASTPSSVSAEPSTQQQQQEQPQHEAEAQLEKASLSTPSLIHSCSVTQPLSSPTPPLLLQTAVSLPLAPPPPPTSTPPTQGVERPAKRTASPRRKSEAPVARPADKRPALAIPSLSPARTPSSTHCQTSRTAAAAESAGAPGNRREKLARSAPPPPCESQMILPMQFTEAAQLRKVEGHPPRDFRIAFILRKETDGAGTQGSFLADVVEQLGATVVSAGSMFGRHRKPTHLVVDDQHTGVASHGDGGAAEERVGLTPSILLAKALGLPIVRPQWVFDAIALGGAFPEIIPAIHLHPIFGQERHCEACHGTADEEEKGSCVAEAVAAAAALARQEREEQETAHDILGVAVSPSPPPQLPHHHRPDEEAAAVEERQRHAGSARAVAPSVTQAGLAPVHGSPGSRRGTMAFLTKTTHDEVMPVGQLWERPYYKPIFAGMDFFLKIDDAVDSGSSQSRHGTKGGGSNSAGRVGRRHAARRRRRVEDGPGQGFSSSSAGCAATPPQPLLSRDEAEAFEQATELIRVLGGTLTRTLNTPHLDIILDLYGFCQPVSDMAGAPLDERAGRRRAEEGATDAPAGSGTSGEVFSGRAAPHQQQQASAVMESLSSLSMAYQEALVRIGTFAEQRQLQSHLLDDDADAVQSADMQFTKRATEGSSENGGASRPTLPPTVGVPWLVHCVLQREKSDVAPFLLENWPDSAQAGRRGADPPAVNGATVTGADGTGRADPQVAEAAAAATESASTDLFMFPARVELLAKTASGPATSRKVAEKQPDTQQIFEVLGDEAFDAGDWHEG